MSDVQVPFFKKKGKGRPTTSRKRSASPAAPSSSTSAPAAAGSSTVVRPPARGTGALLRAGTKRTATQRLSDGEDEPPRAGPGVQYTAAGSHVHAALEILAGDEAEAELARRTRRGGEDEGTEGPEDGLYRGAAAYTKHVKKSSEVPKAMRVGPQRASGSTIRTVTIVDYQPDVCKDYKETGYCGYGDTCKFLHDRGTYLQGWQLDKLAANAQDTGEDPSSSDSDEDIPFACLICRKPYTDPVVTRCGHYFDSACAIKRFARTPKCAACGAPTGGIFNRADKVIEKMKAKRAEREAAAEEQEEGGGGGGGVEIEGLAAGDEGGGSSDGDDDGEA